VVVGACLREEYAIQSGGEGVGGRAVLESLRGSPDGMDGCSRDVSGGSESASVVYKAVCCILCVLSFPYYRTSD
jgi:hypothetical protein